MPPPQLNNSSKHRKQLKITTQVMMGSQPLDSIRETPPPKKKIPFNDMPIVQDAVLASIRPVHRLFKTSFVSTGLRPVVRYMC